MSGFWERALGGQKQTADPPPSKGGAWWQTPASGHIPQQAMPGADSGGMPQIYTYQQLKGMRADQMSQEQMEQLASLELQGEKYNKACPNCGRDDAFMPAGTRVGSQRMPIDKCFHCGSSGALASSPEPAPGGSTGRAGRATRQTDSHGSYGRHVSQLPSQYIPRS